MSVEQTTGLIGAIGGLVLGYLVYRQSRKVDAISAQSGIAENARAGTAQIIEGLNALIDNLQDDNRAIRDALKDCSARLDALTAKFENVKREVGRLRRKYGNGDEPLDPTNSGG